MILLSNCILHDNSHIHFTLSLEICKCFLGFFINNGWIIGILIIKMENTCRCEKDRNGIILKKIGEMKRMKKLRKHDKRSIICIIVGIIVLLVVGYLIGFGLRSFGTINMLSNDMKVFRYFSLPRGGWT